MNTIVFHGVLAERYGSEFKIAANDALEVYRACEAQLPGFRDIIAAHSWEIIRDVNDFQIALTEETLALGMVNARLHFIPVIEGASKKGIGKIILGVAMIGAAFIPGVGVAATVLGMSVHTALILGGAVLALGGLSMVLAPTAKLDPNQDSKNSYLFGGDVNPSGQNFVVPLACGKIRIAGIPIASQVVTNEYSIPFGSQLRNVYSGIGNLNGGLDYTTP